MSPSWITPDTAVELVEDLLALLMSGYTVEMVPLDLIGPDRAALRLTGEDGAVIEPREVRITSMRGLGTGIRQLRVLALGEDDEAGVNPAPVDSTSAGAGLPLGLMAAMFGMDQVPGGATDQVTETRPGGSVRPTNAAAMADAIAAAIRPASVAATPARQKDQSD